MRRAKTYDPRLYDSRYYERVAAWSQSDKYHFELQELLDHLELKEKDTVLDVGCGTGKAMRYINARYQCKSFGLGKSFRLGKVLGLDFPPGWVAPTDLKGFARADAIGLPFADATFSKILLLHVIGHVPQPVTVLKEIHRALVPKGKCGIITPNRLPVAWYKLLNKLGILAHRPDPTVLRLFSCRNLVKLLHMSGFSKYFVRFHGSFPPPVHKLQPSLFGRLECLRERIICVAEKD